MSRPVDELLSRFTPDGSGLDRDALLFAAGRASARPNRRWVVLAACLAVSQVVTLAALWPRPASPAPIPAPPDAAVPTSPDPPTSPEGSLILRPRPGMGLEDLPRPTVIDDLRPDAPPLRAFAAGVAEMD